MANYELLNDKIATMTILTVDSNGDSVPAIAGDVFTVVSSDTTKMAAVLGADAAGAPAAVFNALVKLAPGLTLTITDADGLNAFVLPVDVVGDITPASISGNVAAIVLTSQPVPAN